MGYPPLILWGRNPRLVCGPGEADRRSASTLNRHPIGLNLSPSAIHTAPPGETWHPGALGSSPRKLQNRPQPRSLGSRGHPTTNHNPAPAPIVESGGRPTTNTTPAPILGSGGPPTASGEPQPGRHLLTDQGSHMVCDGAARHSEGSGGAPPQTANPSPARGGPGDVPPQTANPSPARGGPGGSAPRANTAGPGEAGRRSASSISHPGQRAASAAPAPQPSAWSTEAPCGPS